MLNTLSLLNPIYITLFWAIALFTSSKKGNLSKFVLGVFMGVTFLLYLSHFFYFTQQYAVYRYFDSIYTLCNLSVFPMYHVYVRVLTVDNKIELHKLFKHFVAPLLIFVFSLLGYSLMSKETSSFYISQVLSGKANGQGIPYLMQALYIIGRVVFFAQVLFYLIVNFNLLKKNNDRLKEFYSNTENRKLYWVQFFNISFAATSFASLVLVILGRNVFLNSEFLLIIPSIIFSILLFSIGLIGSLQQTEKIIENHISICQDTEKRPLPIDSNTSILQGRIIDLFEREMIYKNPDLNIWDLCSKLNTNRTYISKLINTTYGQNFNHFVNSYRIKYVKVLIESKQKYNNEQLAELSGFGSINSLYRAFQAIEGVSLSKFRQEKLKISN